MVLTVNGRVGFVEDGITFSSEQTLMISGACPPPAPSEWYVWIVRPLEHRTIGVKIQPTEQAQDFKMYRYFR